METTSSPSTTFEFDQVEIKQPAPPINSLVDLINGDGQKGYERKTPAKIPSWEDDSPAPEMLPETKSETNQQTADASIVQSEPVVTDELEKAMDVRPEIELMHSWFLSNSFDPTQPDSIPQEAKDRAATWARSVVEKSKASIQSNNQEEVQPQTGSTAELIEKAPTIFEFEQSESINPDAIDPDSFTPELNVVAVNGQTLTLDEIHEANMQRWHNDCDKAREHHKLRIKSIEQEQTDAIVEMETLTESLKACKKKHKAIVNRLMAARKSDPVFPAVPEYPRLKKPTVTQTTVAKDGTKTTTTSEATNVDTTWRLIKTADIISEDMEGLGPKKREALIHEYPTFGDLEDARASAYAKFGGDFKEVLPDGFGEKLAGRIEDACYDALMKHQKT